jgi:hypothetical protein
VILVLLFLWIDEGRARCAMAKAEASVEELVGMIERGELRLPEMVPSLEVRI